MRRSREEAARTRRTAVEAASRLFRERGIEAASVSEVMASLGMTDGGFYRHFESKEALAAEACAAAFAESGLARASSGSAEAVLRGYLSEAHRDAPGAGCPLPALASDMARQPAAVRQRYTEGVRSALARSEIAPRQGIRSRLLNLHEPFVNPFLPGFYPTPAATNDEASRIDMQPDVSVI